MERARSSTRTASQDFAAATTSAEFLRTWFDHELLRGDNRRLFEEYYGNYRRSFDDRLRYFYTRQISEALAVVRAQPGLRVLEAGCGLGTESLWLAMNGARVDAIDVKEQRLRVAEERKTILRGLLGKEVHCRFMASSLFDLDTGPYDLVWMEQTFHHLEPREQVVVRLHELLRPGGTIVISEANAANPFVQLQLLMRRGFKTITTYVDEKGVSHSYGNERILTARKLVRLMERTGFRVERLEHFRIFPSNPMFAPLGRWETRVKAAPRLIFTHYNYVGVRI